MKIVSTSFENPDLIDLMNLKKLFNNVSKTL